MNIFLTIILTLIFSITCFADDFDKQKPDDVSDASWASLKSAVQEAKLLPEPAGIGGEGGYFGQSVSIDGSRALVGGPNLASQGAAFIYEYDGISWHEVAVLQPVSGSSFGFSVSLSGNRALVGAYGDVHNGIISGSAYVYDYDGMNWNLKAKLIPSDGADYDKFGRSVSLSGNRVLVGAHGDDDNGGQTGSAYVFDYDGINWNQSAKLVASDAAAGDKFGISVSLSGNRVLVGANKDDDNGSDSGSAYVFDYDGMSWNQSAKLVATDGEGNDEFGWSVSLSGDRLLIGAIGDDIFSGSVYVYDYDGMNWSETTKLIASDGSSSDGFGAIVSLSGDRALVGAPYDDNTDNNDLGSAYIYDYDGVNWSESAKLMASDGSGGDSFGFSVSLSGNRVLVGAYLNDDNGINSGSAYIYDYDDMKWSQSTKLVARDGAVGDWFGYSVSLSGNFALVGAHQDDDNGSDSGSAYIYEYDGFKWNQSAKLVVSDAAADGYFGVSVSLSGNRALVGANGNENNGIISGSAYVYDYDGMTWNQSAKLVASDGALGDSFGISVSLSGDRALVGAERDDDNGSNSGSVYVFDYDGMNWSQSQKLTASDGAEDDSFGYSVSLSGDRVLVGAYLDDDSGNGSGSAYVFDYDGINWNQSAKLVANDGALGDSFGISVSLSGDRALVGAERDDDNGNVTGSAYIYNFDGINWNQSAKLTANDGAAGDIFGRSVSLSGDRALVGAYGDDDNGSISGSAYVFVYDGINWHQSAKLLTADGAGHDYFGWSVSLSGDYALVGAYKDDDRGTNSGSAYIIDIDLIFQGGFETGSTNL